MTLPAASRSKHRNPQKGRCSAPDQTRLIGLERLLVGYQAVELPGRQPHCQKLPGIPAPPSAWIRPWLRDSQPPIGTPTPNRRLSNGKNPVMVSPSARTATWASDWTRPTARANSVTGTDRPGTVWPLHGVPRRDLGRAEFVRADKMYCHRILPSSRPDTAWFALHPR